MAGKIALVDYHRCDPDSCDAGICIAALACPRKLLRQEAPHEVPMADTAPCKGCGDCARTCPLDAIRIVANG